MILACRDKIILTVNEFIGEMTIKNQESLTLFHIIWFLYL